MTTSLRASRDPTCWRSVASPSEPAMVPSTARKCRGANTDLEVNFSSLPCWFACLSTLNRDPIYLLVSTTSPRGRVLQPSSQGRKRANLHVLYSQALLSEDCVVSSVDVNPYVVVLMESRLQVK